MVVRSLGCTIKASGLVFFFTARGLYRFLTPSKSKPCLKERRMSGVIIYHMRCAGHYFRYVGNVLYPHHQYSWASFTGVLLLLFSWSLLLFFPLTGEYVFFLSICLFLPDKRVVLESENASAALFRHRPLVSPAASSPTALRDQVAHQRRQ